MLCCRAFSVYCPCRLSSGAAHSPQIAGCEAFRICLGVVKLLWEGLS